MTDLEALALTIWGEAEGEPIEGKLAVAAVIRNRTTAWHASYESVCRSKAQFAAWMQRADAMRTEQEELEGDPSLVRTNNPVLRLCVEIARATIAGLLCDPTKGSVNYLTKDLYDRNPPAWAKGKPFRQFGAQVFLDVTA